MKQYHFPTNLFEFYLTAPRVYSMIIFFVSETADSFSTTCFGYLKIFNYSGSCYPHTGPALGKPP